MDKNYRATVSSIETTDGIEYYAEFPDVPGIVGGGVTPAEAVKEAYENLEVHLEFLAEDGMEIPKPTIFPDDAFSGKFVTRISKTLHKRAKMLAEAEGISLNSLIAEAIANRVTEDENMRSARFTEELFAGFEQSENVSRYLNQIRMINQKSRKDDVTYGNQSTKDFYGWYGRPTYSC